jgi:hypothetical protein
MQGDYKGKVKKRKQVGKVMTSGKRQTVSAEGNVGMTCKFYLNTLDRFIFIALLDLSMPIVPFAHA